jgi:glycosyltransferase involved in cell wall biosynthesis
VTTIEVLLPIRSPAPWLEETLESLMEQSFTDWRLVASIHGDDSIVRSSVLRQVPNALIVNAPEEGNLASTLNVGLAATSSKYIARIDADDVALPERFQVQLDFLRRTPNILAVGSGATLIGVDGEVLGYRSQIEDPKKILKRLMWKSPLMHPSVMFHRDAVVSIDCYSELATNVEDYDLWLRLAAIGLLGGIDRPLLKYRIHPNQITSYRSIPATAIGQVSRSRLALAKELGYSTGAARFRQLMWSKYQEGRRIKRNYVT